MVGASFVGGGAMGFEARPAFVPSEICRLFYSSGEKFLHEVWFLAVSIVLFA